MASPSDPPTGRAGDTEQFPVARTGAHATAEPNDAPPVSGPAHAVGADAPGISRSGWWAITIGAAVLLILGFLLTFGPVRYWTPVPVVFLGYFLISGLIGLVFWKGVRELRESNPTLHSGDGPASPGARVAAAIGAVGVASALVLLPAGLSDAPANAAPCPDGTNTCGPQPTMGPQPTQGNGGNTTAPQAPNTTVPGYTAPDTPPQQGNGSTPTVQGQVPTMPTGDTPPNGCIFNCGPTQGQQAPQTGQATPQTGQNPVTTAPNTHATTPQAPTTTPRLRTPTPETTTSTTSSKARDRDERDNGDEDRDKNSGIPYQAAWAAGVGGTYRRKKTADAVRDGQAVAKEVYLNVSSNATVVSKPLQGPVPIPRDGSALARWDHTDSDDDGDIQYWFQNSAGDWKRIRVRDTGAEVYEISGDDLPIPIYAQRGPNGWFAFTDSGVQALPVEWWEVLKRVPNAPARAVGSGVDITVDLLDAIADATTDLGDTDAAAVRAAAVLAENVKKGADAEKSLGIPSTGKTRMTGPVTGKPRYPDRLDLAAKTLEEVKNVDQLAFTGQLADFFAYSKANGLQMTLHLADRTKLVGSGAAALQQLIDSGAIIVQRHAWT